MIRILSKKEIFFLLKLAAILKDYDATISVNANKEIVIEVFDGESLVENPILFKEGLDEDDIESLFIKNENLLDLLTGLKEAILGNMPEDWKD